MKSAFIMKNWFSKQPIILIYNIALKKGKAEPNSSALLGARIVL
jgi:hypothetical protein